MFLAKVRVLARLAHGIDVEKETVSALNTTLEHRLPIVITAIAANCLDRPWVRFVRVFNKLDVRPKAREKVSAHAIALQVRICSYHTALLHHLIE